jgi:hypothetical protein
MVVAERSVRWRGLWVPLASGAPWFDDRECRGGGEGGDVVGRAGDEGRAVARGVFIEDRAQDRGADDDHRHDHGELGDDPGVAEHTPGRAHAERDPAHELLGMFALAGTPGAPGGPGAP